MIAALLMLACLAPPEPVQLTEAFDVPPPPGARTVEFHLSWKPELGQIVQLQRAGTTLDADVVDVRTGAAGFVVTAYASEAGVELALRDTSGWTVRR